MKNILILLFIILTVSIRAAETENKHLSLQSPETAKNCVTPVPVPSTPCSLPCSLPGCSSCSPSDERHLVSSQETQLSPSATLKTGSNSSAASYPLSTCVVSGNQLGQMGPPTTINYHGTGVHLCCKDCEKDFQKDPDKYLKLLKKAEQKTK